MENLERAKACFVAALEFHGKGRLAEAESQYREALALAPGRESVLNNLAALLVQQHRYADALALCEQALAAQPQSVPALVHAALCQCELGDAQSALALADRAVALAPQHLEAHLNRAIILQALRRGEEALASYATAATLAPDSAQVLAGRGAALASQGRKDEALLDLSRALQADPDSREAADGVFGLLREGGIAIQPGDVSLDAWNELALRALNESWGPPQAMADTLLRLLQADPLVRTLMERSDGPARPGLLDDHREAAALFFNELFTAALRSTTLPEPRFERLLKSLRWSLLERAAAGAQACSAQELAFHCALACQCFIGDYVLSATPAELQTLAALRGRLEAELREGRLFPEQWLAAVACYQPLHALASSGELAALSLEDAVAALVRQQVSEPQEEEALRATMARLTPIDDQVSQAVRRQYEEHPYPRWVRAARALAPHPLGGYLLGRFPHAGYEPRQGPGPLRALVAGCGTGQHAINTARRYAPIEVLAVDLSLASLGYARRKAGELGLRNLRFAQADILGLGTHGERYDLIESVGVLHHLQDPARGLRILAGLLQPGGVMKLGLYSEIARRSVVAVRDYIASRGYTASVEDMRRCREDIMALPQGSPLREVTRFQDFYSLGECRDLLFHVQEHRYTAGGLAELLAAADLRFLGFELEAQRLERYRSLYPADTAMGSLANWHVFEEQHPDTFSGMYQLWVQKPA